MSLCLQIAILNKAEVPLFAFVHNQYRQDVKLKITALEALSIDGLLAWAPRGIDKFIAIQRHNQYTSAKLSIRRVKICNISRIGHNTEAFKSAKK